MAGRIRDDDVAAVRERTDIVKLVSGYLTLKKAGHDRFIGLCPFHTEKTPSFGVSPSKGLYHCFGCGKGGDAIGFLRDVEHLEFSEAVERLAKDVGFTLRYEGDTPAERRVASKRQAMVRANEAAFELYHRTLLEAKEGEEARDVPRVPRDRPRRGGRVRGRVRARLPGLPAQAAGEVALGRAPGRGRSRDQGPGGQRPRPVPAPDHVPGARPLRQGGRDRRDGSCPVAARTDRST